MLIGSYQSFAWLFVVRLTFAARSAISIQKATACGNKNRAVRKNQNRTGVFWVQTKLFFRVASNSRRRGHDTSVVSQRSKQAPKPQRKAVSGSIA